MKCPACGQRLYKIQPGLEEYVCRNEECPANKKLRDEGYFTFYEFYGSQEEINKQWKEK